MRSQTQGIYLVLDFPPQYGPPKLCNPIFNFVFLNPVFNPVLCISTKIRLSVASRGCIVHSGLYFRRVRPNAKRLFHGTCWNLLLYATRSTSRAAAFTTALCRGRIVYGDANCLHRSIYSIRYTYTTWESLTKVSLARIIYPVYCLFVWVP